MSQRLAGFMIDSRDGDLAAARSFWSGALGLPVTDPDEGGVGRYAVLSTGPGGLHLEVQMVEHAARLHLDIEATDIEAEVTRLETLGAKRMANPHGRWWVMQAPTGHGFCVVRWRERASRTPATQANPVSHRSALVAFVLDCRVDSLDAALDFWSAALNRPIANRDQDGDGKYAELQTAADEPFLLLQKVDHDPRIHLDIETDNLDAEVARLEMLGAQRVAMVKRWWVMQAPTGHRFCVVRQQPAKPDLELNEWPFQTDSLHS
jgi:predicted enzyme related to lactoylglutathione lyase